MRDSVKNYIILFKKTLNMSGISWWIIDFKDNPNHYYCNKFMEDTFSLDKSQEFHSIEETCPIAGDYNKNIELACKTNKSARIVIDEYKELLSGKVEEYNNQFPYYSKELNQILYFSSRAKVLERNEKNEVSILYGIIENITLQELQKKEIKEHTNIINKYVITSSMDVDGIIEDVSDAFCEISGYHKDELIGKNYDFLLDNETSSKVYQQILQTITSGKVWSGECKNIKKDKSQYWLSNIISPKYDEKNCIKGYTNIGQNITDKKTIEESAQRDQLTKIYNRMKLDKVIQNEYEISKRYGTNLSLIILDIDFFKSVNDTYGHLTGDNVLIQLSNILSKNLRRSDIVGRWGGEEFIIICPNSNIEASMQLAEKLRSLIDNFEFDIVKHKTASFGIAQLKDIDTVNSLIERADTALYKAKELGRNRVEIL